MKVKSLKDIKVHDWIMMTEDQKKEFLIDMLTEELSKIDKTELEKEASEEVMSDLRIAMKKRRKTD
jgi:hypothetical protein